VQTIKTCRCCGAHAQLYRSGVVRVVLRPLERRTTRRKMADRHQDQPEAEPLSGDLAFLRWMKPYTQMPRAATPTAQPATTPATSPSVHGGEDGVTFGAYGGATDGVRPMSASIRPCTLGVPSPVTGSQPLQTVGSHHNEEMAGS
jgi:hypothetical protein